MYVHIHHIQGWPENENGVAEVHSIGSSRQGPKNIIGEITETVEYTKKSKYCSGQQHSMTQGNIREEF